MSAAIDTLISRLDGVRQVKANGWMSRCPAHNGDGRSLAITHTPEGSILIYCFAHQCEPGDILSAVGMSVGDLFPTPLPEVRYAPRKHAVPSLDLLRVMKHELTAVEILMEEFTSGTLTHDSIDRARPCLERIRKALDLCSG